MTTKTDAAPTSDRELVITRLIDAPRETVFKAWTDPALLKQWFAPKRYTTPVAELSSRNTDARQQGAAACAAGGPLAPTGKSE